MRKCLFIASVLFCGSVYGQTTYTWNPVGSSTDWTTNANWSPNTGYPGTNPGDTAVFETATSSPTTISAPLTFSEIIFAQGSSPDSFTIGTSGGNGITLVEGGSGVFCIQSGSAGPVTLTIDSPLNIEPIVGLFIQCLGSNQCVISGDLTVKNFFGNFPSILSIGQVGGTLGTVVFSGNNSFHTTSIILVGSQTLQLSSLGALGDVTMLRATEITSDIVGAPPTIQLGITNFTTQVPITLETQITIDTQGYTGTWTGGLSDHTIGPGGPLQKIGTGTLTLSGNNVGYSQGVVINGGTLSIGSPANVGSGSITIGAATLQLTTSNTFTSPIILTGAATVDTVANTPTLSGIISSTGSLTKIGSGTLTLSGTNTYAGGTTVSAGTLSVGSTANLGGSNAGTLTLAGSTTFQITTSNTITCPVNLTGNTTIAVGANNPTIAGTISGSGFSFTKTGAGTLTLAPNPTTPTTNSYAGATVSAGILQGTTQTLVGTIAVANNANVTFAQNFSGAFGATVTNAANAITTVKINGTSNATITFTGANSYLGGTEVVAGNWQGSATSPTAIQGNILVDSGATVVFQQAGTGSYPTGNPGTITGAGGLSMIGPGTLTLAANGYTGPTTITGGTLNISASSCIGTGTSLIMNGGTLAFSAGFNLARNVTLSGPGAFNTGSNNDIITGTITGVGPLTKTGTGTLTLVMGASANSYGSAVVTQGVLQGTTSTLTGAIQIGNSGTVTFTQASLGTFNGSLTNVSGNTTGAVVVNGGTVVFSQFNSYSGGTTINTGTLQGNTNNLQGQMTLVGSSILLFDQTFSGAYGGTIIGPNGTKLNIQGGGEVQVTGSSPSFSGETTVNGATLIVNGSLLNSQVTVLTNSTLSGSGTVGTITNSGIISPGVAGSGTLNVNGNVTFNSGSFLNVDVSPTSSGLLNVSGSATLTGTLDVTMEPGFYGINEQYVVLQGATVTGTFPTVQISNPGFVATVSYPGTQVVLGLRSLTPFNGFPYANANERSVGNNLDALGTAGELSSDFVSVIDALSGASTAVVDSALDQMHPAAISALAQTQVELGSNLLSILHHKRSVCFCHRKNEVWVEPFGNWLHVKQQGMEIGFQSTTRGVAIGYEREFFGCWTFGVGGAYSATDLKWSLDRGYAYIKGACGALYSDVMIDRFYLGLSGYGGKDWYNTQRRIRFTTIDRQAHASSSGLDLGAQMSTAYYFGMQRFLIYPYALVDYVYLNNKGFAESGAGSLDLDVNPYISSTLRVETGGAFRFADRNIDGTICISPFLGMGYVWERPFIRTPYHAKFTGTTISFTTWGWDKVWQMLSLKMGLAIVYRCFTLDGEFIADISSKGGTPIVNQRANFRMSYSF